VLSQVDLPQMLIGKQVMLNLGEESDTLGEIGYYMATLEAASIHMKSVADVVRTQHKKDKISNRWTS
jgi:hypothetical protein